MPSVFTIFCRQTNDHGTTWIDYVVAETKEEAAELGVRRCADEWGMDDVSDVSCVGIAEGNVKILHWEDLTDD